MLSLGPNGGYFFPTESYKLDKLAGFRTTRSGIGAAQRAGSERLDPGIRPLRSTRAPTRSSGWWSPRSCSD